MRSSSAGRLLRDIGLLLAVLLCNPVVGLARIRARTTPSTAPSPWGQTGLTGAPRTPGCGKACKPTATDSTVNGSTATHGSASNPTPSNPTASNPIASTPTANEGPVLNDPSTILACESFHATLSRVLAASSSAETSASSAPALGVVAIRPLDERVDKGSISSSARAGRSSGTRWTRPGVAADVCRVAWHQPSDQQPSLSRRRIRPQQELSDHQHDRRLDEARDRAQPPRSDRHKILSIGSYGQRFWLGDRPYPPLRSCRRYPGLCRATLVGISSLDDNRHFASDVIAGAVIGYIVGRAATDQFRETRREPRGCRWRRCSGTETGGCCWCWISVPTRRAAVGAGAPLISRGVCRAPILNHRRLSP